MMSLSAGSVIKSTPALAGDPLFAGVTILITAHGPSADGAVGYIINRPFGRRLNELAEFRHGRAFPLYDGGPVDREHLFFVHRRPDLIEGGVPAGAGIYAGGDFRQAVAGINAGLLGTGDLKLFIGYCGWDAGELEAEIGEGSWMVTDEAPELLFT
ncbi:YqgE/AlgH family protein [Flaviaesturariibacter amylovorans]|uniref:YqgE/AlgH family protein n=1 Tax=Flaviaesturariibacter amylovorans TaxID=1084520 RepID=A0ABP8G6N2_9BACT